MSFKHRLERLYKFEYWSFWVLYSPFILQWFYYSIRSLSFVYFTRANYKTPYGAFFQYSKYKITETIQRKYLPNTLYYTKAELVKNDLENDIYKSKFVYKPDFGERGIGVELFNSIDKWKSNFESYTYPCLIESYIDLPIELGVLFYRLPTTVKNFFPTTEVIPFLPDGNR